MKKTVKILIMMIAIITLAVAMTACSFDTSLLPDTLGGGETTNPTNPDGSCNHVLAGITGHQTATCMEEGFYFQTCNICGENVITEIIPKEEHSIYQPGGWPGNCLENGYTSESLCGWCGKVFEESQVIETIGIAHDDLHLIGGYDVPGTCISNGWIVPRRCISCHEDVNEYITLPRDPENHVQTKTASNVEYCLSCETVTSGSNNRHLSDVHCCKITLEQATYCLGCGKVIYDDNCTHANINIYHNSHYGYEYAYCVDCGLTINNPMCNGHAGELNWRCDTCGVFLCNHNDVKEVFNTLQCSDCHKVLAITECAHSMTTTLPECTYLNPYGENYTVEPLTYCNGCGMFFITLESCKHSQKVVRNYGNGFSWLWCIDCKEFVN